MNLPKWVIPLLRKTWREEYEEEYEKERRKWREEQQESVRQDSAKQAQEFEKQHKERMKEAEEQGAQLRKRTEETVERFKNDSIQQSAEHMAYKTIIERFIIRGSITQREVEIEINRAISDVDQWYAKHDDDKKEKEAE